MKNKGYTEDELRGILKDLNIEIYVYDDVTLAVKRQDRIEKQWLFAQLNLLIKVHGYRLNNQIIYEINSDVPFQPVCKTKTSKKTPIFVHVPPIKASAASIFQKHKFMKKFLKHAMRNLDIPFGYSLRNPVDEPDGVFGAGVAVNRLLDR